MRKESKLITQHGYLINSILSKGPQLTGGELADCAENEKRGVGRAG